jgi:membrane associated rhomboid family serine protease
LALNISFPKWTFIFIAISIVGFIFKQSTNLWIYFAFFPALALSAPWMFITSIFRHVDLSHLFFNMFALFFFGIYLERMIGGRAFLTLFFLSGIIGNVSYLLTANDPFIPAIGASGAVYGIIGALAALVPFMMIFIYGIIPVPMIIAAAIWVIIDLVGLSVPSGVANAAHLGGIVVGVSFGIYVRIRLKSTGQST